MDARGPAPARKSDFETTPPGLDLAVERFAALSSPARIQIVRLLLAAHNLGGMIVGDIQDELGIPGSTLTHHLDRLKRAGLVDSRKDRQWIWYSANTTGLRQMLDFLYQECCSRGVSGVGCGVLGGEDENRK